jgi:hypothetical protein
LKHAKEQHDREKNSFHCSQFRVPESISVKASYLFN